MNIYLVWAKLLVIELLPYAWVLTCNAVIITKSLQSVRFRKRHAASRSASRKETSFRNNERYA